MTIFQSAVRGPDGQVDAGYLAMYWALIGWSVSSAVLLSVAVIAVSHDNAPLVIQNTGVALGANAGGFAAVLGAVGLFRMGDKRGERRDVEQQSITVSATTTPLQPPAIMPPCP